MNRALLDSQPREGDAMRHAPPAPGSLYCRECGSRHVQISAWIRPNSSDQVIGAGDDGPCGHTFCETCEDAGRDASDGRVTDDRSEAAELRLAIIHEALCDRMNARPIPEDEDGGTWRVTTHRAELQCETPFCTRDVVLSCGGGAYAEMCLCYVHALEECERREAASPILPAGGSPGYDHAAGYHD